MLTGAQAIVKSLEAEGVTTVFGYPGAAICPFLNELEGSSVHYVLMRHEQSAGHAANGYARISGRPGVCFATSGPGATNLITALATAYMDSIPVIAITGQVASDLIGRDVFQEADITGAAEPFCKHSYLIKDASSLPRIFREAFYIAGSGRPGPVLIDIPIDIQQARIDFSYPEAVNIRGYRPSFKGHALQIKRVAQAIEKAKKPVICAGGGIFSANACAELKTLAENCGIPVVTTLMGIGALPTAHPLNIGMLGTYGVSAANRAIHEADLLVIVGGRVGDRAMAAPGQIAAHTQVVHIDVDPAEIGKNMETELPLVGDAGQILSQLAAQTRPGDTAEWVTYLSRMKGLSPAPPARPGFLEPRAFIELLSDKLRDDAIYVADVGQNQIWSADRMEVKNGRFLTSGGMGTMGYSLPAALGAAFACKGRQVVSVCGDGSFQMCMMELATAVHYGIGLKIVVMRNNRLGMVYELQTKRYHGRHVATVLDGSPDFVALAAAYGIPGEKLSGNASAAGAIDRMLGYKGPYLLECAVSPDESSL